MTSFHNLPTRTLTSSTLELTCLAEAGPRIVSLRYKGSPNLFCELPEETQDTPYGSFHLYGGHRFWHAPEVFPRSYIPDNEGLTITEIPDGLVLEGQTEPGSGIRKKVEIRIDPDAPIVSLNHTLTNQGPWEVELAPWALSMCRLGGKAILPIQPPKPDPKQLLPNRRIALWSYTQLHDRRLRLEDEFILIDAQPSLPPVKIGVFNPQGWIAYYLDGLLFRKTFEASLHAPYPDFGCNAELYCNDEFIELESLGPLSRLAPGRSVSHAETWQVYEGVEQEFMPVDALEALR